MAGRPDDQPSDRQRESGSGTGLKHIILKLLETDLEKKDRATKIFQFFFPWVVWLILAVATTLIVLGMKSMDQAREMIYVWVFYTIPPLGKETIIPTVVAKGVPPFIAGISVALVDIIFSLFLIWNYDWVKKIPIYGKFIERTEEKGREKIRKHTWFQRLTFVGTSLFVLVPASGSGGFGGTIFGRIVGMKPYKVLLAVSIGATIGSTAYATLSGILVPILEEFVIFDMLPENITLFHVFAVVLVGVILLYVIRNPRSAAEKGARFAEQTMDVARKAVMRADHLRKETTNLTVMSTKETIDALEKFSNTVDDINLRIATGPMMIMGNQGKQLAYATKQTHKKTIGDAKTRVKEWVIKTLNATDKTADRTFKTATDLTVVGIDNVKEGVTVSGYIIVFAGDRIEKVYKVPRNLLRNNGKNGKGGRVRESGKGQKSR